MWCQSGVQESSKDGLCILIGSTDCPILEETVNSEYFCLAAFQIELEVRRHVSESLRVTLE
jgi:hypothetical protein